MRFAIDICKTMTANFRTFYLAISWLFFGLLLTQSEMVAAAPGVPAVGVRLSNHVPHKVMARSSHVGRAADRPMTLTVTVPLHDEVGLQTFVARVSDPKDPLYGQYLSPNQVLTRFGPTAGDIETVKFGF